jgi:hypothetical protein
MTENRAEAIAKAHMRAAQAALEASLLAQSNTERGCTEPTCPGPRAHPQGGCPMGWAGSCQGWLR